MAKVRSIKKAKARKRKTKLVGWKTVTGVMAAAALVAAAVFKRKKSRGKKAA